MKNIHVLKTDKLSILFIDIDYSNFLKTPLNLGMFIPCDENFNMLKKPNHYRRFVSKDYLNENPKMSEKWLEQCQEYRKAESKILFKNFDFFVDRKGKKCVMTEGFVLSIESLYTMKVEDVTDKILSLQDLILPQYMKKTLKKAFREYGKQKTLEKYSERFNNKDNEVVDGIFNPENWGRRVVKQETLEEAAERAYTCRLFSTKTAFIAGAKWQEQNSNKKWSEEDMRKAFYAENEGWVNFDLWFEQFKKK